MRKVIFEFKDARPQLRYSKSTRLRSYILECKVELHIGWDHMEIQIWYDPHFLCRKILTNLGSILYDICSICWLERNYKWEVLWIQVDFPQNFRNSSPRQQSCLTLLTYQFIILHFGSQTGRLPTQVDGALQLPASVTKQTSVRVLIVSVNIVRSTYHPCYPSRGNALLWWMLYQL